MAKRYTLSKLPQKVRDQLHERLVQNNFSRYQETAEWLTGLGHPIGRSALYSYVWRHRADILVSAREQESPPTPEVSARVQVRLRCLEVAAKVAGPKPTPAALTRQASELLAWVLQR